MASGDRPNTSRKPKGVKKEKLSQKEQSERFKETARELGVDETGEAFEKAFKKVSSAQVNQKKS
jgi:hypothetical protein